MQFRPEGILPARLVGTEKGVKSKSMEEENKKKGWWLRTHDGERAIFIILGYRSGYQVGPWPANHNPQLGDHPSKGTWTPAHDLHKKSFFLHARCLKVFKGVSLFNFPYRFTQSGHPFQFLWRLTYWSLHRDF